MSPWVSSCIAVLAGVALCGVVGSAHADDNRFGGSFCRPLYPYMYDGVEHYTSGVGFSAWEVSHISCPILRDDVFGDFTNVQVYVTSGDADGSCGLWSIDAFSESTDFLYKSIATGSQTLTWTSAEVTSYASGYYSVICTQDEASMVISAIKIAE